MADRAGVKPKPRPGQVGSNRISAFTRLSARWAPLRTESNSKSLGEEELVVFCREGGHHEGEGGEKAGCKETGFAWKHKEKMQATSVSW